MAARKILLVSRSVVERNQHCGGKASSKPEGLSRGGVLEERR